MHLPKYALVDAFDALSDCSSADERWRCAIDVTRALGVDAINTGCADIESASILWARSSMTPEWLETYMKLEFFKVDPLLELFHKKKSRLTVYCDLASIEQGIDDGHPALSRGLNDAGYALLHGTKFLTRDEPFGSVVTLCFGAMKREKFDETISRWTTLSALIAAFSYAPDEANHLDVFTNATPVLTRREVEVLSLLATGLQTARIAERLNIAEITVAKHFRSARRKLGSRTREQALIKAMQFKLLSF